MELPEIGSKWVALVDYPQGASVLMGDNVRVVGFDMDGDVEYQETEKGDSWYAHPDTWYQNFEPYQEDKDYVFKVGDKVVCRNPQIVCKEFKDKIGEIVEHKSTFEGEQVFLISYGGGYRQVAYSKRDVVELLEEAGGPNEKTPTELTAGGYTPKDIKEPSGKIASDGGSSAYYDFPEGSSTLNDLIEYKDMSFAQGNIFKAAYRLGNKEGISLEYDLKKIIYYAERMLAQIEGDK